MVFVTGGTGFIGTHLLRALLQRGEKIRALKRTQSKIFLEEEFSKQIEWIEGDVLDIGSLEDGVENCEEVYHCAAFVRFLPQDRDQLMKVNIEGTANVVNACLEKNVSKLVHVSSVAAIGRSRGEEVVNENSEWEDSKLHSQYAISKFLAEREVWRGIAEGLNAVIANPSLIIGSGNWNDGSPSMFKRVNKGLMVYTEGGTGIVTAEDVVNLMIHLMKSDIANERFIISAEEWSFKDLFFYIADQLNAKRPSVKAGPMLINLMWRLEEVASILTKRKPIISKEMARIATRWSRFNNDKIVKATNYKFASVKTCIEQTAKKFLEENH